MDSSQYIKKCLDMLNNNSFIKSTDEPNNQSKGKFKEQLERSKVSIQ